jgi:hypothetical protein
MVMTEYSRVSFRIPDSYSEILNLVTANGGVVDGAGFAASDYDELFAMHVDDVVEARFSSEDRAAAEKIVASFVSVFDEQGIPHAIATSAKPEGVVSRYGGLVGGTVYVNSVGYIEAQDKRELPGAFNPDDSMARMLRKSGLTRTGIEMVFSAPVTNNHSTAPGF